MKKIFIILFFIICFLTLNNSGYGVSGLGGTTGANFLKIGIGARALGMGEAFVALADDASAAYWNPAGLVNIENTVLYLEHTEWFDSVRYEYVSIAEPSEAIGLPIWGAMAFSWFYLYTPDIPRAIEDPPNSDNSYVLGTFSAGDTALSLSYGGQLTDTWAVGGTVKYLNQKVDYDSKSTVAMDLGFLSASPIKNLRLGMVILNIGDSMSGGRLPTQFKLGVNYKLSGRNFPGVWNNTFDIGFPLLTSDQIPRYYFGEEYIIKFKPSQCAIRAGYRTGRDLGDMSGLTVGLGYLIKMTRVDIGLDYAFLFQGDLGYTHHINLTTAF